MNEMLLFGLTLNCWVFFFFWVKVVTWNTSARRTRMGLVEVFCKFTLSCDSEQRNLCTTPGVLPFNAA